MQLDLILFVLSKDSHWAPLLLLVCHRIFRRLRMTRLILEIWRWSSFHYLFLYLSTWICLFQCRNWHAKYESNAYLPSSTSWWHLFWSWCLPMGVLSTFPLLFLMIQPLHHLQTWRSFLSSTWSSVEYHYHLRSKLDFTRLGLNLRILAFQDLSRPNSFRHPATKIIDMP